MWPNLFGPDWAWIAAGALAMALVIAAVLFGLAAAARLESPDHGQTSRDDLWHRYEIGDLTREEFERLRGRRHAA